MAENQHFASIIRAYDEYRAWGLAKADRLERHYGKLSAADRAVMRVDNKVAGMRAAVEQNARVIAQLVAPHRASVPAGDDPRVQVAMPQPDGSTRFVPTSRTDYVPESDLEKVQSTLKQFVREWGAEGRAERESAHGPVLDALRKEFPQPEGVRVLLPGAGLGRLVWEVAMAGYVAQGCEFSYFMLIAADFLMNRLGAAQETVTLHPWALQTCNAVSAADQLRPAVAPEVPPSDLPEESNLSMCAGDFLEVYRDSEAAWEALVTLFFVDTAHDPSEYVRAAWRMIADGGVWINMGPLLWHFHDMPGEVSIELTWQELRSLIVACGFVFEREEWCRCSYTCNPQSLYQMQYNCIFFVARRPPRQPADGSEP